MASLTPPNFFPATPPSIPTLPTLSTLPSGIIATTFTSRPSLPAGFIRPTILSVSLLSPGTIETQIPSIPPPLGVEPNFSDPVTLAVSIIVVSVVTAALAIVFLSLRLYSTFKVTRSASYDDGGIILAMALSLTYAGLIISTRDNARHGWDQPISAYTASFFKIVAAQIIVGALAFLFSKVSVLLLLLRLFPLNRTLRYLVYFGVFWTTVTAIMALVAGGTLCAPRHNESNVSLTLIKRCTLEPTWALAQGVLNMILNFAVLSLPIPIMLKSKMRPNKRIGVAAIFIVGFLVCVVSTIGLAYRAKTLQGPDLPWNTGIASILAIAEINLAIIVACTPACALFSRYLPAKPEISPPPPEPPCNHDLPSLETA